MVMRKNGDNDVAQMLKNFALTLFLSSSQARQHREVGFGLIVVQTSDYFVQPLEYCK